MDSHQGLFRGHVPRARSFASCEASKRSFPRSSGDKRRVRLLWARAATGLPRHRPHGFQRPSQTPWAFPLPPWMTTKRSATCAFMACASLVRAMTSKTLSIAYTFEQIVVAIPSATLEERKRIYGICTKTNCQLRNVNAARELRALYHVQLREVDVADVGPRRSGQYHGERIPCRQNRSGLPAVAGSIAS